MRIKYILISITLLIVLSVFLIFYPLRFDFYEQTKAKRIVDILILPLVFIFLINYVLKTVRKGNVNWEIFPKEILFSIILFGLIYFTILRSVLSCGLLFINCALKENEKVEINGTIINITKIEGHGKVLGNYEVKINQNGKEFNFESNKKAIENFSLNGKFKMEMNKGTLNLMYK
jgi:hypothetical protein